MHARVLNVLTETLPIDINDVYLFLYGLRRLAQVG
jgi:hypothetical protein